MQIYRFGGFELDLDAFELKLPGKPVKLERRALDLLALLVRQPNRLIPREEIIAALWPPNVIIDFDSGINTLVRKVRAALGDSSESPRFIETIPGRGYRFVARVETVTALDPAATQVSAAEPGSPARSRRRQWLVAAAVVVSIAAALVLWRGHGHGPPGPTRIAVLPFENLTGDASLAYLASGLAEDTGNALAQIDVADLHVVRVLSPAVSQGALTAAELGAKLKIDYAVLSSLRVEGARIRVSSRLVRTADDEQVWSQSIDRELTNVLGVQRELSTAIAEQIRLRLSPRFNAAIARRQTRNPAAYALYLKARYEWSQLTPASTRRALEYFKQATQTDPGYALAWAGLAFGAITSIRTADASPLEAVPIARHALAEALRLGPELAETQYAQGYWKLFHELDVPGAEQAARAAIRLDPDNAQAHMLLGVTLMRFGHAVEGRDMLRRARELEPMFALLFANSANVALAGGDTAAALEFSRQTIAINPDFWLGHYYLGLSRAALGQWPAALEALDEAARLSDGHSLTYPTRVDVLLNLGRRDQALALLEEAKMRAARQYMPPYEIGWMYALLGDNDSAFTWFDRAIEVRDVNLLALSFDRIPESLRKDPRLADLMRRCGCGPESKSK